jgi:hypothetical protein
MLLLSNTGRRPAAAVFAALLAVVLVRPAWGGELEAYQWKNRLLLVIAPNDADPRLMAFERRLSASMEEVRDRDLLSIRLLEAGPTGRPEQPLPPEDVHALRRRYGAVQGGFAVILIGKDGGVKLVQEEQVSLQAIFDLIDTMPMRRQEMRLKGAGGPEGSGG